MKNVFAIAFLLLLFSCAPSVSLTNKTNPDSSVANDKVSIFWKNYGKEIYYNYSSAFNYTKEYLNELYLIAEYYIANSKNELLRTIILNKEKVEYSVEQQQRNGKEYTVLGVGTVSEGSVTKAQWLYYDAENKILYEYDLPNDELVVFE